MKCSEIMDHDSQQETPFECTGRDGLPALRRGKGQPAFLDLRIARRYVESPETIDIMQGLRELCVWMIPLGFPVRLGPDDNPLGLHVEIHLHDLPRDGYSQNLLVEICALRRQACLPKFPLQEFPPEFAKRAPL